MTKRKPTIQEQQNDAVDEALDAGVDIHDIYDAETFEGPSNVDKTSEVEYYDTDNPPSDDVINHMAIAHRAADLERLLPDLSNESMLDVLTISSRAAQDMENAFDTMQTLMTVARKGDTDAYEDLSSLIDLLLDIVDIIPPTFAAWMNAKREYWKRSQ